MPLRAFLNRCRTQPLILVMLGLCSCGSGLRSLPLINQGSSVAMIYSIDSENHRVLRYTPNEFGTATLVSSINLPISMTATLVTTDAAGGLYIGGYTTSVNHSEVLVYEADATDDNAPLRTLKLRPGKLIALAVDRQSEIYAAQMNARVAINIYSGNFDDLTPIRSIDATSFVSLNDLAVDSAGNVYVSGWNGTAYFIREFSSTATGAAAAIRSIPASRGSTFGGLAVDDRGNIFAMEDMTICKFGSGNTAIPIESINLPAKFMAYTKETSSNVLRRDGIGDFFVPVTMNGSNGSVNMVYGFASNAKGDASPILQFTAEDITASGPMGQNVPLAVF